MLKTLQRVIEEYPTLVGNVDCETWLSDPANKLYEKNDNVAIFTCEYPGVYSGHWFFKVRGRAALNLAHEMLKQFFEETNAQTLRGLVRLDLLGSRWAARQIGMKSYGIIEVNNRFYELFCMTRKEYNG